MIRRTLMLLIHFIQWNAQHFSNEHNVSNVWCLSNGSTRLSPQSIILNSLVGAVLNIQVDKIIHIFLTLQNVPQSPNKMALSAQNYLASSCGFIYQLTTRGQMIDEAVSPFTSRLTWMSQRLAWPLALQVLPSPQLAFISALLPACSIQTSETGL